MNALSTVRYVEFGLTSCHHGSNEVVRIGQNLVPFLSTYMPHLQILRLWREDDFPWTSSKFVLNKPTYVIIIKFRTNLRLISFSFAFLNYKFFINPTDIFIIIFVRLVLDSLFKKFE